MQSITLHTRIDEHHQIILDVPKDLPIGEVEVTIRPIVDMPIEELTREEIQARLKAAGLLADLSDLEDEEYADVLTDEELDELMERTKGGKTVLEMVNEDRGEW